MAWSFDEVNDYVTLADNAALTLPDSDWAIGGLIRLPDTTGSLYQYFLSWGTVSTANSLNIYVRESDGNVTVNIGDSGASRWSFTSTDAIFAGNTNYQHLLIQRSGDTVSLYWNGFLDSSAVGTSPSGGVNSTGSFYIGGRSDLNADRYLGGDMAGWAKWDRALSAGERQALGNSWFAPSHFMDSLSWYCPMIREYTEVVGGLTVTNNGSTIADHPPMIYPQARQMPVPVVTGTDYAVVVNDSLSFGGTGALNVGRNVVVNDALVFDGTGALNVGRNVVVNDSLVFDGTHSFNVGRAVVVNDTLVFGGTGGLSRNWMLAINDSLAFDGTGDVGRKWDAVINDGLVFDGTGEIGRYWPVVVNDALVFDGTGVVGRYWPVVVNDALVFDGTGSLNRINNVVVNDALVFDGTGTLNRYSAVVINDALVFDGTGTLNRINNVVVNDALVFDGTVSIGRGSAVVINDSLVFGGSITAALAKKWYDTGDDTALSLSWSNTADDTATDPSWSDSPDDTATDPSWGDI